MIPYKIIPMFHLGLFHLNMYGVMFMFGFLVALYLVLEEAKKKGIKSDIVFDIIFYILISSIIGARFFYILFYWPTDIVFNFWDIFKIWEGGLAFYGGFLGGVVGGLMYAFKNKLDILAWADLLTVPLIVGHILGRIGDYLTGGHPGIATNLPWGINFMGELRHPIPLYEIIALLFILLILKKVRNKARVKGAIFFFYIGLYAVARLFLDIFRISETDPRSFYLTPTQWLAIGFLIIAIIFITRKHFKGKIKSFICSECWLEYKDKIWADKCYNWCHKNKTCNLEITKYSIK